MVALKVPYSYLSMYGRYAGSRFETLMDRSFLSARSPFFGLLGLDGEGNVGFPGLEATIHEAPCRRRAGAVDEPRCGTETGLSYKAIAILRRSRKLCDVQGGLGFQGPELHFSGQSPSQVYLAATPQGLGSVGPDLMVPAMCPGPLAPSLYTR
jgi:hypothetical protein